MSAMHHGHGHGHGTLTQSAALASVGTALFLIAIKAYAAADTGSVAMLGSLADTGLDFLASLVTLFGVRVAAMPADWNHRFGHGKAEALAALAQVALIAVSALLITWRAIERLRTNEIAADPEHGIVVSLIAMGVTLALLAYQRRVIRRTGSVAIETDHLHYKSDLLLNLSVIGALVLESYAGVVGADPVLGILIAAWLLWSAARASTRAIDQLMDKEWPPEKRRRLAEIVDAHPASLGLHDLRTRTGGNRDFAQFHIWLRPDMTVTEAHGVMDEIEERLGAEFPGLELLIHPDPEGHVDREGHLPHHLTESRETAA